MGRKVNKQNKRYPFRCHGLQQYTLNLGKFYLDRWESHQEINYMFEGLLFIPDCLDVALKIDAELRHSGLVRLVFIWTSITAAFYHNRVDNVSVS